MLSLELTCGCLLPFQTHATDPRHLPSSPARLKHLSSIQRLPFVGHVSSSLPPWSLQVFRTVSSVAVRDSFFLSALSCLAEACAFFTRHPSLTSATLCIVQLHKPHRALITIPSKRGYTAGHFPLFSSTAHRAHKESHPA